MVEHRCLRCGASVGRSQPAASTVHGPTVPDPDALPPRPSEEPPALPGPASNGSSAAAGEGRDDDHQTALSALAALRELGELHAAGVLTDGEFAAKKAELLRRV
jgi:hypothetical protein